MMKINVVNKSANLGDLSMHMQTYHMSIEVNIERKDQQNIACEQCEYKCRLNIQLKKHIKTKHQDVKKYNCEECYFSINFVANQWEHSFKQHPEQTFRFNEIQSENTLLKIVAEQNGCIREEIETMKEDTKGAFHKLALAITDSLELMRNETKEEHKAMNVVVEELVKKIIVLESKLKTTSSISDPLSPPVDVTSTTPAETTSIPPPKSTSPKVPQPSAKAKYVSSSFQEMPRSKSSFNAKTKILYVADSLGHTASAKKLEGFVFLDAKDSRTKY